MVVAVGSKREDGTLGIEAVVSYPVEGVKAGSMHHIAAYGLTVGGMAVLALICGGLSGRFGAKASTGFARNLRREMYRNVQKFSFANIDKFSTSGLNARLTTDETNVQ